MPTTLPFISDGDGRLGTVPSNFDSSPQIVAAFSVPRSPSHRRVDHGITADTGAVVSAPRDESPFFLREPMRECSVAAGPSSMSLADLCLRGWRHQSEVARRSVSDRPGMVVANDEGPDPPVGRSTARQHGEEGGGGAGHREIDTIRLVGSLRCLLRMLDDDEDVDDDEANLRGSSHEGCNEGIGSVVHEGLSDLGVTSCAALERLANQ